jgi:Icc-related predicted phosphoesterase
MSTFVYASDLHGNIPSYEELFRLQADAVVLGGDLLPHPAGAGAQLFDIQREFARTYLAPKLAERPSFWLFGNDDWESLLPVLAGKGIELHRRSVPFLDGYSIAGYSCVPVTPFGMKDFDRYDEEGWSPPATPRRCLFSEETRIRQGTLEEVRARGTIARDLEELGRLSDPARTVYVMHSPPHGTSLDCLFDGTSVGSRAIRAFIESRQPPITLHGHIHESPGIQRLGRTLSANPGDSLRELRALRVDLETRSITPLR